MVIAFINKLSNGIRKGWTSPSGASGQAGAGEKGWSTPPQNQGTNAPTQTRGTQGRNEEQEVQSAKRMIKIVEIIADAVLVGPKAGEGGRTQAVQVFKTLIQNPDIVEPMHEQVKTQPGLPWDQRVSNISNQAPAGEEHGFGYVPREPRTESIPIGDYDTGAGIIAGGEGAPTPINAPTATEGQKTSDLEWWVNSLRSGEITADQVPKTISQALIQSGLITPEEWQSFVEQSSTVQSNVNMPNMPNMPQLPYTPQNIVSTINNTRRYLPPYNPGDRRNLREVR